MKPAVLVLVTSMVFVSACGFDPVARCNDVKEEIATQGANPNGLSPNEVCRVPAIENVEECGELYKAIQQEYSLNVQGIACDCPPDEPDPSFLVGIFDEACQFRQEALSKESCAELEASLDINCAL